MKKLLAVGSVLALFGAGCALTSQTAVKTQTRSDVAEAPRPNPAPPAPAEVAPQAAPIGSSGIVVADQKTGAEVKIGNVVLAKQGYVVIHADENGKPGKILGVSALLNAGETRDVTVKLRVEPGVSYWAMLHSDNGNKKFSDADQPTTNERGEVVMKRFAGEGKMDVTAKTTTDVSVSAPGVAVDILVSATIHASIQNFAFSQKIIKVKKGDKIIFTNKDNADHTVTADGGAFSSASLSKNQTFTLDTSTLAAGSYGYHCTPHPYMTGMIVVE